MKKPIESGIEWLDATHRIWTKRRITFKSLLLSGMWKLEVSHNDVSSVPAMAFYGLERALWELHLPHNKLTRIPSESLTLLKKLSVLNLAGKSKPFESLNHVKDLYHYSKHGRYSFFINTIDCTGLSYFDPKKYILKEIIRHFSQLIINFLVRTLKCAETCAFFAHKDMKKPTLKSRV